MTIQEFDKLMPGFDVKEHPIKCKAKNVTSYVGGIAPCYPIECKFEYMNISNDDYEVAICIRKIEKK